MTAIDAYVSDVKKATEREIERAIIAAELSGVTPEIASATAHNISADPFFWESPERVIASLDENGEFFVIHLTGSVTRKNLIVNVVGYVDQITDLSERQKEPRHG